MDENSPLRKREEKLLIEKLIKIGVLNPAKQNLDAILSLTTEDFLERRLQTQVFRLGLAATPHQARQLIVHGHIAINGRRVTKPSYHLSRGEEEFVSYAPNSPYRNEDHAMRKELLKRLGTAEPEPEKEVEA